MSYPLSESFATAPATGYTAVLGGMAATHNNVQQSIDISAPNSQSILRFNETAHGDFWFEADVEFLTDPSARKSSVTSGRSVFRAQDAEMVIRSPSSRLGVSRTWRSSLRASRRRGPPYPGGCPSASRHG